MRLLNYLYIVKYIYSLLLLQAGQPLDVSNSIPCIEQGSQLMPIVFLRLEVMLPEFFFLFADFTFFPFN